MDRRKSSRIWTALHVAAQKGDFDVTKYLISQGAEMNKGDNGGVTALHSAALKGHLDVTKYLINQGAEMNEGDNTGLTALHIATKNGHLDVTKYLISQGAEVNKGDIGGGTALHSASQNGHLDVTKYLISQGAEMNKGDNGGVTALHSAALKGHLDVTELLISSGADLNKGNNDGRTALHSAAKECHLDVTKYLISQGAEMNKGDNGGVTALHSAALKGRLDVTKYLICQGAVINKGDNGGVTALHSAALKGHLDVTELLISQGADLNKGNNDGRTALHIAAFNGHLDVTKYLISQGAEVNKGDIGGGTALHSASQNGHLDVTKYLISQGADVNRDNNDGWTALHLAAQNGHLDVTEYLISQGAEVNRGDNGGVTALPIASQNGHLDVTKYLISQGAEVNKGDIGGGTALHSASQNGHLHVTKYLISQGAEAYKGNYKLAQNDSTDIHLAIQHGHTSIIEKLVSEDADLNVQSTDGQTCLHKAIKLCYKSVNIVQETDTLRKISDEYYKGELSPEKALVFYLLENGAKLDVRDKTGNLPIQYAKDEVIKQMILSRVTTEAQKNNYDNLTEKAQSDRTDSVEPIDHTLDGRYATGHLGAHGGTLSTKSHGFTLHIPPGALEEDEEISLRVLTEIPIDLTLKEDELLVSHGFQCYPSGLRFKKPAKLIIPHCALVTAPNKVQAVLYSWNQSGPPKRLPDSSNSNCSVQERWLEVSISHFSGGFFIALPWDWLFLKGILLSCMPFLPRLLPPSRKPILKVCFVKKPHFQKWKDVHALNDPHFQPVKGDDDDIVFQEGTLTVACQLGEKSPKSDVLAIRFSDMRMKMKVTKYCMLDLTEESDETLVTLEVDETYRQTIIFNTRFQGIDRETTEQNAPSPSSYEIPSNEQEVTDANILNLAMLLPPYLWYSLQIALRIDYSTAKGIIDRSRDITEQYIHLLQTWKAVSTRTRKDLNAILTQVEAGRFVDKYLD